MEWSIHQQGWPKFDEKILSDSEVTIVIQVNGKVRDRITVGAGAGQEEIERAARASAKVAKFLTAKPKKVIFVAGKLINFVT